MAPRTVQRFTPPTAPAARPPLAPDLGLRRRGGGDPAVAGPAMHRPAGARPATARPGAPLGHRGGAPAGVVALIAGGAALGWSLLIAPAAAQAAPEADAPSPEAAPVPPRQGSSSPGATAPDPLWSTPAEDRGTGPEAMPPGETTAPGQPAQSAGAPRHQPVASPLAGRIAQDTLTVRAGESLWSLTGDLIGPTATEAQIAERWPLLWQANADRIRDPDRVLAGTVLQLPRTLLPEP